MTPDAPEQTRKRIEQLRRELEHHNRRYYIDAAPEISDRDYDRLLKELEDLETAYPDLVTPDSPTQRVGGAPLAAFQPVTHNVPMMSLANTYDVEELGDFEQRLQRLLPDDSYSFVVEPKVDGVAVCAVRRRHT